MINFDFFKLALSGKMSDKSIAEPEKQRLIQKFNKSTLFLLNFQRFCFVPI